VPDVAVATAAGVVFLRGDGAGGFEPFVMLPTNGEVPGGICIGDVHLDGHPDLVTSNLDGTASVLPGDGLGGFGPAETVPVGNGSDAYSIAVGDVTGDGWPDLVVPRDEQDRVFILQGDGTGAFVLESAGYVIGDFPSPVVLADVNEDGRPDVLSGLFRAIGVMPSIGQPFTWKSLGAALPGSKGEPGLAGHGTLAPGSPVSISLVNAWPSAAAYLVIGATKLAAPFKGGVLVPNPQYTLWFPANAAGNFHVTATFPNGVPAGVSLWHHVWWPDPAGPAGFASSNAIRGITP